MGIHFGLRRAGLVIAVAAVAASTLAVAQPRVARAYMSPPSFTVSLSPDNVVPGPGQPGAVTSDVGINYDGEGGLCWWMDSSMLIGPNGVGIYQGVAGTNGPLVVELSFHDSCAMPDQSILDAMVADPAGYYLQISTTAYPDGATRGQLALVVPTNIIEVATWICSPGTTFPITGDISTTECGNVVRSGGASDQPWPGMTTTGFGGIFPIDYRVTGPQGYSQRIDQTRLDIPGAWCNPETLRCFFGLRLYEWENIPLGPVTVTPVAAPKHSRLAYTDIFTIDEGVAWSRGDHGAVTVDLNEQYYVQVHYYYLAADKVTKPLAGAPTVEVGMADELGQVPLTVTSAGTVRGASGARYDLEMRTDNHGPWRDVANDTSPVSVVSVASGHTYVFRVRAIDAYGIASNWAVGAAVTVN